MGSKNRNAFCSFCKKSYHDVGPLVEGPGEVYICGECIVLCQSIIEQEKKRRGTASQKPAEQQVDPTTQRRELLRLCLEGVASWVEPFLEETNKRDLNANEVALLEQIRAKAAQLQTLMAAHKRGSS
jgi:hypothetical protein